MQTAERIGLHLGVGFLVRDGLRERLRPSAFLPQTEFRESIFSFFKSPDSVVYGSESSNDVAKRIESEIHRALSEYPSHNVLMVTHGAAMTSFISCHTTADAYSLWKSLALPAYVAFSVPSFDIVDSVGTALDELPRDR